MSRQAVKGQIVEKMVLSREICFIEEKGRKMTDGSFYVRERMDSFDIRPRKGKIPDAK
jgi:hypothetical protein